MARNLDEIQREIERTRNQLAGTLDELAARTKPAAMAEDVKSTVTTQLQDPKVKAAAAGVAALAVGAVIFAVSRSRKRARDLRELKEILAARRV